MKKSIGIRRPGSVRHLTQALVLILITISGCGTGTEQSSERANAFSITSEMHYSKPHDHFVFIKDYLTFSVQSNGDTLIYSHQRDSMRNIPRNPEQTQFDFLDTVPRKYSRQEYFLNGKLSVNEGIYYEYPIYRRDEILNTLQVELDEAPLEIFKMQSLYFKDKDADTLLLNSTEYWTEPFGRIARIDQNFNIRRGRKMMLSKAFNSLGDTLFGSQIEAYILSDSLSWMMANENG